MNVAPPDGLTTQQWLLLQYLYKQNSFFYTELLYTQFSAHRIERLEYYRLFYSLVSSNYIMLDSISERRPDQLQDFRYTLTRKGRRILSEHSEPQEMEKTTLRTAGSNRKAVVTAYTNKTVVLKDYSILP